VIKRFRHKGLEEFFRTGSARGIDVKHAAKLRRILTLLNEGPLPQAMNVPGYRLHQLKGDRKGEWAVWVSSNRRVVFEIEGEHATNVDLADYH
jgi:toxin HigB-1